VRAKVQLSGVEPCGTGVFSKDPLMVLTTVNVLLDSLRETNLLRAEQVRELITEIAPKFVQTQELAKHLIRIGWVTLYQAKKLLSGHGQELIIGHYVVLDKLGEGGMGKVYKAKQLRLSRIVALKVIRPNLLTNELALKRFQREAKAAAQLSHPNIVRLFDADQVGDRHFLAMECVEGPDLATVIKDEGRLPVSRACSYIRQAALGLQHAHDLGLVHRDIKPSNLLVTKANTANKTPGGVVKILDMGLARATDAAGNESALTALTQDGAVIGTPDFMSPEQAKNSSTVDGRSDLYSLGCTFYYLLVGHAPFRQGSTLEKLLQHQMDPPPHIQLLRPDVPDEVAAILHTLLAKGPEDRFQSGAALATALEPWSVFDPKDQVRKSSMQLSTPSAAPPALPVATAATEADPFDFNDLDMPQPPKARAREVAETATIDAPRKKRQRWWIPAVAAGFLLAVGTVLIIKQFGKSKDSAGHATPPAGKEEPPKKDKEPPPVVKKNDYEGIDAYLPADTELVAVLNVQQLNKSKFFQEELLPRFKDMLEVFRTNASFDPLKAIDRVIVALPASGANHSVVVVQGSDFLTSDFLNWVRALPGVTITSERVPGHGSKDVYRLPPSEKDKGDDTYGAILSISPTAIVLSSSKERVIEALARVGRRTEPKFDDASLRPMLAKYGQKSALQPSQSPPTLWMCLGCQAKLFGFGSPKDGGVQALLAAIRLGDGMDFEVTIEAGTRQEAIVAWGRIATLVRTIALRNPTDKRLERIASLFVQANPGKFPGAKLAIPFVGHWSHYIKPEQMAEWFAPFFEGSGDAATDRK
jgi:serine/threonine protein kinase